jgi:hypothetical protein
MIIDGTGNIIDFLAWGYSAAEIASMDTEINGFRVTVGDQFVGDGFNPNGANPYAILRHGDTDNNNATDFTWDYQTKGVQHGSITVPFSNQITLISTTPVTTGNFTAGIWTGDISVLREADGMFIRIDDNYGQTGDSNQFDVEVLPDADGDKLADFLEDTMCTDPNDDDSDDDGIIDGDEDVNQNGTVDTGETDPCDDDSDDDGMPDGWENSNSLDPLADDAFDDADSDGYSNLREFLSGSGPWNDLDVPDCISDLNADIDVDGSDLSEIANEYRRTDCLSGDPCDADLDNDGDVDDIDFFLFIEDFGGTDCF